MKIIKKLITILSLASLTVILTGCFSTKWPMNDNTNGVPEPTFKMVEYIKTTGNKTIALYNNVSTRQGLDYVAELQNNGFTEDLRLKEEAGNYYFKATNVERNVSVTYDRIPTGIVVITCEYLGGK